MNKRISMMIESNEDTRKVKAYIFDDKWNVYDGIAKCNECDKFDFMVGANIAMERALENYNKSNTDDIEMCDHYFVPDIMDKSTLCEAKLETISGKSDNRETQHEDHLEQETWKRFFLR